MNKPLVVEYHLPNELMRIIMKIKWKNYIKRIIMYTRCTNVPMEWKTSIHAGITSNYFIVHRFPKITVAIELVTVYSRVFTAYIYHKQVERKSKVVKDMMVKRISNISSSVNAYESGRIVLHQDGHYYRWKLF